MPGKPSGLARLVDDISRHGVPDQKGRGGIVFFHVLPCELRRRIFRTESDQIDHGRIDPIAGDLLRVPWIADQYEAGADAVDQPVAVKSGYVGPLAGIQDHFFFLSAVCHWLLCIGFYHSCFKGIQMIFSSLGFGC